MAKTFQVFQTTDIKVTLSTAQVERYEREILEGAKKPNASPFAKHLASLIKTQGVEAAVKSSIGNMIRMAVKLGLQDAQNAMSYSDLCKLTYAPPRTTTVAHAVEAANDDIS